jgi:exosortase
VGISKSEMIKHIIFLITVSIAALMMYGPLNDLFASSFKRDYHTLIPFIPIISIYLLSLKRNDVREKLEFSVGLGAPIIAVGLISYIMAMVYGRSLNLNDYATVQTISALMFIWGAFILAYGLNAFRTVLFPLLFLVFMIPVPAFIMEEVITFLQSGSTEFTHFLLWISHAPFYRDGFVFHLPGISVEVAPQCSGIRSGYALFITSLLASYMFLGTWSKKIIFVILSIPVTMLKNGIRITTLTLLGTYVDPRILQSSLHREGGIPFFILALVLMAPILFFLRRLEVKGSLKGEGGRLKTEG